MAAVLGIGGVFFKVADPEAVRDWYRNVLGLEIDSWGGVFFPPPPKGGTVWSPFPADSNYMDPGTAPFMINFIVDDIDAMLEKAAAAGAQALGRDDDSDPHGRFAWLLDPAGIKVELWEPQA